MTLVVQRLYPLLGQSNLVIKDFLLISQDSSCFADFRVSSLELCQLLVQFFILAAMLVELDKLGRRYLLLLSEGCLEPLDLVFTSLKTGLHRLVLAFVLDSSQFYLFALQLSLG